MSDFSVDRQRFPPARRLVAVEKAASAHHYLASLIFVAPLNLFFNPYVDASVNLKYLFFGGCAMTACLIVSGEQRKIKIPASLHLWNPIGLALVAVYTPMAGYEDNTVLLYLFCILLSYASFVFMSRVDVSAFLRCLMVGVFLIVLSIWRNFDFLSNWTTKEYKIGTLSFDSYPVFGLFSCILALQALYVLRGAVVARSSFARVIGLGVGLFSLYISFYVILNGQSRGEALIFFAVVTFYLLPRLSALCFPIVAAMLYIAVQSVELPLFERIRVGLDDGFHDRTEVYGSAIQLLQGDAFWTGLGVNGFQKTLGLPVESHPHNSALEALLTGGVLYFTVYLVLFVRPLWGGWINAMRSRDHTTRLMFSVYAFVFLISLKSQSIFSNWHICYFLPLAFLALKPTAATRQ